MASVETLITAEEFGRMPDDGRRTELVRGRVIELPPPRMRHGQVCGLVSFHLMTHARANDLGHVLINDTGVVTEHDPDTVRGADVAYFSFARLAKGRLPAEYPTVPPELVIEVRSPSDRWRDILAKVAEYLEAGVLVVCVLDPESRAAHLYYPDQPNRTLGPDDELTFPECLPGFRVVVRSLFE